MSEQVHYEDVDTGDAIPVLTVIVDETQLFFFSAATYNGHRIHYDKEWARDVEGYDDVLVHGPLQAALLSRTLTDWIGGERAAGRVFGAEPRCRPPGPGTDLRRSGDRKAGRRGPRRSRHLLPAWRRRADAGHRDGVFAAPGNPVTGLRGEAAIIGIAELAAERRQTAPPSFTLDQYAFLAKTVIEDAGVDPAVVNGLSCHGIAESDMFAPATLSEYLGLPLDFGDRVDLGGATAAGMVWRAAAAVELGACDAVLAVVPGSLELPRSEQRPARTLGWYGASSNNYGSPQAEFEIPYGNVGQNGPYAQIAQRYAAEFGYDAAALARIAVHQRTNACAHPGAVFHGKPITVEDVLNSPIDRRPDPHARDGDAGAGRSRRAHRQRPHRTPARHRPVWITGFGEHIRFKTPTYADDLIRTPIARAAEKAFAMAAATAIRRRHRVDLRLLHDHRADDPGGRRILRQR